MIGTYGDHGNCFIKNLSIQNAEIAVGDTFRKVGILCGLNQLNIHNCQVSGTITCGTRSTKIGGICGSNGEGGMGGIITHCQSDISISSSSATGSLGECGGICGYNGGTVANCSAAGEIDAWSLNTVGGICGYQEFGGDIISSWSSADISAQYNLGMSGGLCGHNYIGTISHCYATGNVISEGSISFVGGLCGYNRQGKITACYSTGNVACGPKYTDWGFNADNSGGFCGRNSGVEGSEGIWNCYSTGDLTCGDIAPEYLPYTERMVGGFCGNNYASIVNCYSTGTVVTNAVEKAGFCYWNDGSLDNCFWDTATSGITTGIVTGLDFTGVEGKITAEMQDSNTFLNAGWDFIDETTNGVDDIWAITSNQYPSIYRELYSGGDGSPQNPFRISSAQDLISLGKHEEDYYGCFIIINDIDLSGYVFDDAVIAPDTGTRARMFNGSHFYRYLNAQGHSIDNLTIQSDAELKVCIGLFGAIGEFAEVRGLRLQNVSITGSEMFYVGGVCGLNSGGTIKQCSVSGNVQGRSGVGGISGVNGGYIYDSYVSGSVVAPSTVGGICGMLGSTPGGWGHLERCYSTASVQSDIIIRKGGLAGSIGSSAFMRNCFWDTDTSGLTSGYYLSPQFWGIIENVEGYTTFQMKQQASFEGWDFENVWWIDEGNDYPILRWQLPNTVPVADAGCDQMVYASLDGYALVYLDGTASYDADGDVLEYYWYNDVNELIATGAEPNVVFGVGEYKVTLIVHDGIEDSLPDSCVITVVDPFEALAADIAELVQHRGTANSLTGKLDAARKKLEDGNEKNDKAAVNSLKAFINTVNAQRGKKISEDNADALIAAAQQIIDML
ncbi:MAG: GLUG motif-containing protein [Planctomycetota bacterium]